ncbi:MAG: hypothetical protein HGB05_14530 [Chloroflexi bacterium]|nr:hypothetical protein [Chloroflexota bacterium]
MRSDHSTSAGVRHYRLKVAGLLNEEFVRQFCPPELKIDREAGDTLLSNIRMDQAGLIGLIRRLHNLNCVILTITGEEHDSEHHL